MSEVYFYHLTRSALEDTVPEILQKCLARQWRVLLRGTDTKRMVWLDEKLWGGAPDGFLPHGFMTGANDAHQPVLLTEGLENTNAADVLVLVDGAQTTADEISQFSRVCLIFDENNQNALTAARNDWKSLTSAGVAAQYWSQESGKWQQKAKSS